VILAYAGGCIYPDSEKGLEKIGGGALSEVRPDLLHRDD
jgi:hypothetical protein